MLLNHWSVLLYVRQRHIPLNHLYISGWANRSGNPGIKVQSGASWVFDCGGGRIHFKRHSRLVACTSPGTCTTQQHRAHVVDRMKEKVKHGATTPYVLQVWSITDCGHPGAQMVRAHALWGHLLGVIPLFPLSFSLPPFTPASSYKCRSQHDGNHLENKLDSVDFKTESGRSIHLLLDGIVYNILFYSHSPLGAIHNLM